jgi:hypothetical protein
MKSLMATNTPPTGSVPGAIANAGMTMAGAMGYGCGSPDSALASGTVPPMQPAPQPQMIENYGPPFGGVVEYLDRWGR